MNKQQRAILEKAKDDLEGIMLLVEEIKDEEQGKFDDANEGLQATQKYQDFEENATNLDTAESSIAEAMNEIEEVLSR